MKSLITKDFGITNAKNFESMVSNETANLYVMVGRSIKWANTINPSVLDDDVISTPYDTTEYKYQVMRDGVLLKKVTASDMQLVAPRVDWATGTVYVAYEQSANLFVKSTDTRIVNLTSNGVVTVGSGALNTINSSTINFSTGATPALSVGLIVKLGEEQKEVVSFNASAIVVNTAFASAYTNANLFATTTSTTQYSNKFYVRNTKDQVFKCLFNNGGAQSVNMPEITIGGQLPENPFIETDDGYKWKYLYTIPTGLKNKFFTDKYMPVIRDTTVFENSKDGRIDIVKILNGGSGYFRNSSENLYDANTTVTGDGTGASLRYTITDGVITDITILNGGNNYTTATLTLNDPLQNNLGLDANLQVIISPQNGHGYDPVREIGASSQMISLDFDGDMNGLFKVQNDGTDDIRQICLVKDPKFATNSTFMQTSVIPMYTLVYTNNPASDFQHDEIVFVPAEGSSSYEGSIFSGRVVHFDSGSNILVLNNIIGAGADIVAKSIYQKDDLSRFAKVITVDTPDINIFSGEILYIENRSKITRSTNQTESVKLVVEF
jgi:hypothetical protein